MYTYKSSMTFERTVLLLVTFIKEYSLYDDPVLQPSLMWYSNALLDEGQSIYQTITSGQSLIFRSHIGCEEQLC